jgi:hypothetical protein
VAQVCDDGSDCTDDTCDPASGLCLWNLKDCEDGDPCTFDYCTLGGACEHLPQPDCP